MKLRTPQSATQLKMKALNLKLSQLKKSKYLSQVNLQQDQILEILLKNRRVLLSQIILLKLVLKLRLLQIYITNLILNLQQFQSQQ